MRVVRLGLFFLSMAMSAPGKAQLRGSVTGHVYCNDSRTPCRFAGVVIQTAPNVSEDKPTSHSYSANTDIDGAYTIDGIEAGEYYILGNLQGYVTPYDLAVNLFSGDRNLIAQATEIALTRIAIEASRTSLADLTLTRGAAIAGTVQYDDGSPAINLPVHLFRKDQQGVWKPYTNTAGGYTLARLGLELHTDDRGEFHEPGLPPGTYAIEATLPQVTFAPSSITGATSMEIVVANGNALKVYSGNKLRLREAQPIELKDGEQRLDLQVVVPTHGMHTIHGKVTSAPDRHAVAGGGVSLLDTSDREILRRADIQTDGSFLLKYVPTGSYLLSIEADQARDGQKKSPRFAPMSETILVDQDMQNLNYVLVPVSK